MSSSAINEFSAKLLNQAFEFQNYTGNLAISGVGVFIMMANIFTGLSGISITQMIKVLNYDLYALHESDSGRKLLLGRMFKKLRENLNEIADTNFFLFYGSELTENFARNTLEIFDTKIRHIDFKQHKSSLSELNEKISINTGNVFEKFYNFSISVNTDLVFINTMFFYKDWLGRLFDEDKTGPTGFIGDKEKCFFVNMMKNTYLYKYFKDTEGRVEYLFMVYENNDLFAALQLPNIGIHIKDVVKNMSFENLFNIYDQSKFKNIHLRLPRFNVQSKTNIAKLLFGQNITNLFTEPSGDIVGINGKKGIIDRITQGLTVIVNEFGTRKPLNPYDQDDNAVAKKLLFNRPFLFHLCSAKSMICMFNVIVTNPSKN